MPRFPGLGEDEFSPDVIANAVKHMEAARKALAELRGWEPTWSMFGAGLREARAHVRLETTTRAGRAVQETTWCICDGATHARERFADGRTHEWVMRPPIRWSRWGDAPWEQQPAVRARSLAELHMETGSLIQSWWGATPVQVIRQPWGKVMQFVRRAPAGAMEWEIESGTGLVKRMRAWDSLGNAEWEETREFSTLSGHRLLSRRLRTFPSGIREDESIIWTVGTHVTTAVEFAAPQP